MRKLDLILDTDVGSDCDDMMALAYLVYAKRHLGVTLRAVTHSYDCPLALPVMRAMLRELGEALPPFGRMPCEPRTQSNYCAAVAERFVTAADAAPAADAVKVLRRALTESHEAVLCGIGPMTNLAALLSSEGDEISPLDGIALVRRHCSRAVVMAGRFADRADGVREAEWNVKCDVAAAQIMVAQCPVPLYFLPFEMGEDVLTGGPVMELYGESTPLSLSFVRFGKTRERGGRPSWDPMTALFAVEGEADRFACMRGRVTVDQAGVTRFAPQAEGLHRVICLQARADVTARGQKARIAAYIDACAMRLYAEKIEKAPNGMEFLQNRGIT